MKYNFFLLTLLLTGIALTTITCNKKDIFPSDLVETYTNLQVGKYIIYKLDSTVFTDFGQTKTIIKYQAKDIVDAAITDNLGRPGWRIIRYIRDSASTNEADWKPNITYMITVLPKSIEVVEENQRYIKLKAPLVDGYSWKGNAYISPESFDPSFSIDLWDYTYENVNEPFDIDGTTIPNTITINQRDEILGDPDYRFSYSITNFSKEVYAKDIGLVYKDLFHSEYQPFYDVDPGGDTVLSNSYYLGYGIKLRMISHN